MTASWNRFNHRLFYFLGCCAARKIIYAEYRVCRSWAYTADDEVQLRQLPRELHPGRHEAREGQERAVVVYESTLDAPEFFGSEVTHDLEAFKAGCDVIVANRWRDELADVADKVYTRELFKRD